MSMFQIVQRIRKYNTVIENQQKFTFHQVHYTNGQKKNDGNIYINVQQDFLNTVVQYK